MGNDGRTPCSVTLRRSALAECFFSRIIFSISLTLMTPPDSVRLKALAPSPPEREPHADVRDRWTFPERQVARAQARRDAEPDARSHDGPRTGLRRLRRLWRERARPREADAARAGRLRLRSPQG